MQPRRFWSQTGHEATPLRQTESERSSDPVPRAVSSLTDQGVVAKVTFLVPSSTTTRGDCVESCPRQRRIIFRLPLQGFARMIASMAKGYHYSPASLWRVTLETWLRRQGSVSIRESKTRKCQPPL